MKTFPQEFIERINSLTDGGKLVLLVEIDLDSATTRYYCSHEESVTFNSIVYEPLPMRIDNYSSNSKGEMPAVSVSISNLGNEALEVLEEYDILENMIVMRAVNLELLTDTTAQSSTELMVIGASTLENGVATFILGLPIATDEDVPRTIFTTEEFPGIPQETNTYGI